MFYYNVKITTRNNTRDEVKFDLNEENLRKQFLTPYENNNSIVINGKVIYPDDIERIRIYKTYRNSEWQELSIIRSAIPQTQGVPYKWLCVAKLGEDMTAQLLKAPRNYNKPKSGTKVDKMNSGYDKIFMSMNTTNI